MTSSGLLFGLPGGFPVRLVAMPYNLASWNLFVKCFSFIFLDTESDRGYVVKENEAESEEWTLYQQMKKINAALAIAEKGKVNAT